MAEEPRQVFPDLDDFLDVNEDYYDTMEPLGAFDPNSDINIHDDPNETAPYGLFQQSTVFSMGSPDVEVVPSDFALLPY